MTELRVSHTKLKLLLQHKEGTAWVILVNLLFGLITMFHLAYLGVMFDQTSGEQVSVTANTLRIDLVFFKSSFEHYLFFLS